MTRRINGWHMTAIFVGFFGVIIAVNITMATLATRSFGGTVVDNSYVASQRFNTWLEAAREQDNLDWSETVSRANDHIVVQVQTPDGALETGSIAAIAEHPLGQADPVILEFSEIEPGQYRSDQPLVSGRWLIRIEIAHGEQHKRILVDLL